jgi:glycosyltransferase involved in cell wall biosynthesis
MNKLKILNLSSKGKGGLEAFAKSLHEELKDEFDIKTIAGEENLLKLWKLVTESNIIFTHKNSFIKKIFPALIIPSFINPKKQNNKRVIAFQNFSLIGSKKKDIFHKILYSKVDKFITISKKIEERMKKNWAVDPQKIITIYCGVDNEKFSFSPEIRYKQRENLKIQKDEIVFGVVAKFLQKKNQEIMIKAISNSEKLKNEKIKIIFAGAPEDKKYYKKIKDMIKNSRMENKVIFLPFTEEINKIYNAFDFLVITSKDEAFGLVGLEALATKIPVISPDEAGISEILEDGKDSFIYKTNNEKSLAEKIETALGTSEEKRKMMGEYGRRKIEEKFTMKRCASDIKKVIYELISSSPKNKAKVLE